MTTPEKDHLIRQLRADLRQATGRNYQIDFERLDIASIRELMRLSIDLKYYQMKYARSEASRQREVS